MDIWTLPNLPNLLLQVKLSTLPNLPNLLLRVKLSTTGILTHYPTTAGLLSFNIA